MTRGRILTLYQAEVFPNPEILTPLPAKRVVSPPASALLSRAGGWGLGLRVCRVPGDKATNDCKARLRLGRRTRAPGPGVRAPQGPRMHVAYGVSLPSAGGPTAG